MRIVAGRHRGRAVSAPPGRGVRPTPDRVREAVFNMLEHRPADGFPGLLGAAVLDAFCGTGALGLEALSRGAAHATFLDSAPAALAACRGNVRALGEGGRATVLRSDCLRPARAAAPAAPAAIAFADPPYRMGMAAPALDALRDAGWIGAGTLCVVQTGAADAFEAPDGLSVVDDRRYGATRVRLLV